MLNKQGFIKDDDYQIKPLSNGRTRVLIDSQSLKDRDTTLDAVYEKIHNKNSHWTTGAQINKRFRQAPSWTKSAEKKPEAEKREGNNDVKLTDGSSEQTSEPVSLNGPGV